MTLAKTAKGSKFARLMIPMHLIIVAYHNGEKPVSICKRFGINHKTMLFRLKEIGIKPRGPRKYPGTDRKGTGRIISLRTRYNMDLEHYQILEEKQNGGCAICGGKNQAGRHLAVDHCHRTGRIRGLLCTVCNTGLGAFNDDIMLMQKAIAYVS